MPHLDYVDYEKPDPGGTDHDPPKYPWEVDEELPEDVEALNELSQEEEEQDDDRD